MVNKSGLLNHPHIDKIVFALSVLVCFFWYTGSHVNVYKIVLVGAIFELAWLPMLALFLILPIISILLLIKNKVSFSSLPLYSLLILLMTFLILTFY